MNCKNNSSFVVGDIPFANTKKEEKNILKNENEKLTSLLLDSSLITRVRFDLIDYKIIRCGNYLQVYYYQAKKKKINQNLEKIESIKRLDINDLHLEDNNSNFFLKKNEIKEIQSKNIIRTKLTCQRLAKANAESWESFITLTYAENMQDLSQAKKDLYYFCKNVQKKKVDFKYIAIPEFQKRGAIHFHLLTNLSIKDKLIITQQKDNCNYYNVKYWSRGFTSFEPIKGNVKKIIGYISKYMTKECDNRLFSIKRFTSSQNLNKPVIEYLNLNDKRHLEYFKKILDNKEIIYKNQYLDNSQNPVIFEEFYSKS